MAVNGTQQTINKVFNLIILDESGSMESIKKPTINGFNELIQSIKHSQKETPEIEQYVNFFSFNGGGIKEILPLINASHLKTLNTENYQPDNCTPLYDAIGIAVSKLRHTTEKDENYSVLVTIFTDGEENASQEYTFHAIAAMIKELKEKGWVFTYIGANHNVEQTAMSLNIHNHIRFNATVAEADAIMKKNISSRMKYMDKIKTGRVQDADKNYFED